MDVNKDLTVGGDMTMQVAGQVSEEAESITFTVGPSSMITNIQGVFFNAPQVTLLSGAGGAIQGTARLGDTHQCPQMSHEKGTIQTASPNVIINGVGAARYGDPISCQNGSTDTIHQGVPGIYINKQPAATRNHQTKHQGVIQTGSENVMLGGMSSAAGQTTLETVNQRWHKEHHGKYLEKPKKYVDFGGSQRKEPLVAEPIKKTDDDYDLFVAIVYAEAASVPAAWEPVADCIMTLADNQKEKVYSAISYRNRFTSYTNPYTINWNAVDTSPNSLSWKEHNQFIKAWAALKNKTINGTPTLPNEVKSVVDKMYTQLRPYYDGNVRYQITNYYSPDSQAWLNRHYEDRYPALPSFLSSLVNPEQYYIYIQDVPVRKFKFYYIPKNAPKIEKPS